MAARDEKGRFKATIRGQRNRVHIRLTDETYRKVRNLAADSGRSIAAQIESMINNDSTAQPKPFLPYELAVLCLFGVVALVCFTLSFIVMRN